MLHIKNKGLAPPSMIVIDEHTVSCTRNNIRQKLQ